MGGSSDWSCGRCTCLKTFDLLLLTSRLTTARFRLATWVYTYCRLHRRRKCVTVTQAQSGARRMSSSSTIVGDLPPRLASLPIIRSPDNAVPQSLEFPRGSNPPDWSVRIRKEARQCRIAVERSPLQLLTFLKRF